MKTTQLKLLLKATIILFLVNSCCKEPLPVNHNTLFGQWNIIKLDSGSMPDIPTSSFIQRASLPSTGTLSLNQDSTGSFSEPIRNMTGQEIKFTWSHNKICGYIKFDFANGETWAWIQSELPDTLNILFADYLGPDLIGGRVYYNLVLAK